MKVWKKLYIGTGRIMINIPMGLFIYSGFDPEKEYVYKVEYDSDEKCFKVKVKRAQRLS